MWKSFIAMFNFIAKFKRRKENNKGMHHKQFASFMF